MFKKYGKISFSLSFVLLIGFTLASIIRTFLALFITNATTWDGFFKSLGTVLTTIVLGTPLVTSIIFLAVLITGFLFKDKIYSFITSKGNAYEKITNIFSVLVFTTAVVLGAFATISQVIYFFESFNGVDGIFKSMGNGGDAVLAGLFQIGFKIATWVLYLVVIAILCFFIYKAVRTFVTFAKANKDENANTSAQAPAEAAATSEANEENN